MTQTDLQQLSNVSCCKKCCSEMQRLLHLPRITIKLQLVQQAKKCIEIKLQFVQQANKWIAIIETQMKASTILL